MNRPAGSVVFTQWQLRAEFAARLSELYGREVPAYLSLVRASQDVNAGVLAESGAQAERFGSIDRVTAERHGAIRVGTPAELSQLARIFGALGMQPVGFYDLRDGSKTAIPVVSTAFRPIASDELARNPFRVFTSMLTPDDTRFFDDDTRDRLVSFLAGRELFAPELLTLADRAEADGELTATDAERFLDLAVTAFALSDDPVDEAWYRRLERVSAVAADIGGVSTTHINHLTPRVLDIDALHALMTERGIEMIDSIQGPPRWDGPDVLLRQTSFRALDEQRLFRRPDGSVEPATLRVRFGEVEARGIALTPAGRERYDILMAQVDSRSGPDDAAQVWRNGFPRTEAELLTDGLGYFTFAVEPNRPAGPVPTEISQLVQGHWLRAEPIVYEDFLPRSAAGIFQSNLATAGTGSGNIDAGPSDAAIDIGWLADAIGRPIHDPFELYAAQQADSLAAALQVLSG